MKTAFIVVGLGYGDEGKGGTVDFLTRKYNSDLTVRFSGGSQCGHGVLGDQGYHVFSQFGSGTLAGAETLIGPNVYINPYNLEREAYALQKIGVTSPLRHLFIHSETKIITPLHVVANRQIELNKGKDKHGSCGHGVWEARKDYLFNPTTTLTVGDILNSNSQAQEKLFYAQRRLLQRNIAGVNACYYSSEDKLRKIIKDYRDILEQVTILDGVDFLQKVSDSNNPVFEGNQGIGLDENYGFFPYVTATDTTSRFAFDILNRCSWAGEIKTIGCTRIYTTRHGVGPFLTESDFSFEERHNCTNDWQDNFRYGWLDINLLKYSLKVDPRISCLSISHLDQINAMENWRTCVAYVDENGLTPWNLKLPHAGVHLTLQEKNAKRVAASSPFYFNVGNKDLVDYIVEYLNRDVAIESYGAHYSKKKIIELE